MKSREREKETRGGKRGLPADHNELPAPSIVTKGWWKGTPAIKVDVLARLRPGSSRWTGRYCCDSWKGHMQCRIYV